MVCLNLQRMHLEEGDQFVPHAHQALLGVRRCLDWARAHGVPVAHVHSTRPEAAGHADWSPAIAGYEPLASEPVLRKQARSFFDCDEYRRSSAFARLTDVLVLGFTAANDCLAAALDAERRQIGIAFVSDAIASPDLYPLTASAIDQAMLAVIGQFARLVTSMELVDYQRDQDLRWTGIEDWVERRL